MIGFGIYFLLIAAEPPKLASDIPYQARQLGDIGLDEKGIRLTPKVRPLNRPQSPPCEAILQDVHSLWNPEKFKNARAPVLVGEVLDRKSFQKPFAPNTSDLPIKFPGSDYRLPVKLAQFEESVQRMIDFETSVNPSVADYYAYLTIHQGTVAKETSQRSFGPHSDSIQGKRRNPKTVIEHGYVVSNDVPTGFYIQPFDMSALDVNRHHFNAEFRIQADEKNLRLGDPFSIYFFDAYSIHTATKAELDTERTFVRLIYSVHIFDRLGNTHNPLFDYDWKMQPRPFPAELVPFR